MISLVALLLGLCDLSVPASTIVESGLSPYLDSLSSRGPYSFGAPWTLLTGIAFVIYPVIQCVGSLWILIRRQDWSWARFILAIAGLLGVVTWVMSAAQTIAESASAIDSPSYRMWIIAQAFRGSTVATVLILCALWPALAREPVDAGAAFQVEPLLPDAPSRT
jgi:hypothetical protein